MSTILTVLVNTLIRYPACHQLYFHYRRGTLMFTGDKGPAKPDALLHCLRSTRSLRLFVAIASSATLQSHTVSPPVTSRDLNHIRPMLALSRTPYLSMCTLERSLCGCLLFDHIIFTFFFFNVKIELPFFLFLSLAFMSVHPSAVQRLFCRKKETFLVVDKVKGKCA